MDEEAATLLRGVLLWRLSAEGWARVRLVLDGQEAGSATADRMLIGLELVAPPRIVTRVPDQPAIPVPDDVRERVNELIHSLDADPDPADE